MSDTELLADIAERLQDIVQDGWSTDAERDVYLIAIRRMCPRCDAKPEDGPTCVYTGEPHPWVHGSSDPSTKENDHA